MKRINIVRLPAGRRAKWIVVALWIVAVAVAGPLSAKLTGTEKNDASAWLPSSAESTKVVHLLSKFQPPNTFTAVIVYTRPGGITSADKAKSAADARRFAQVDGVLAHQITGPVFSADGKAIETAVPVNLGQAAWSRAPAVDTALHRIADAGANGMAIHLTGPLGVAADSTRAFGGTDGTLVFATLAVVIMLLLVTYRSPILWLLPVITAGIASVAADAVVYLLARHAGLTVNGQSASILIVLVFGAGTDYALLLTARYRDELRNHVDRHDAMAAALRRAGPAVCASGAIVIASLLTMLAAELTSTRGLGPVLAIGVAVALLAMLTLLPALLVIVGRWAFWPVRPEYGSLDPSTRGLWARLGRRIAVHPRKVWIATAVVLAAMAIGLGGLKAHGLTTAQSFVGQPDSIVGQQSLDEHLPGGSGQPLEVVTASDTFTHIQSMLRSTPGVAAVTPAGIHDGHALLHATLTAAPDSEAAYATVDRVRAAVHAVAGAHALVGGNPAVNLDVQRAATHDREVIIPVVLAVVFLLLVLLLRALIAPLIVIATVVLSFAAALGASAVVFDHAFGFGGADTSFPLFVFVFLVALGIDYNVFLITRVREHAQREDPRSAGISGLAATGAVITSAGAVLAGTFAVLATLPLTFLAELGFAVAFGVLLDTFVVRAVLVTALTVDLGRWAWWPGKLARQPVERPANARPHEVIARV